MNIYKDIDMRFVTYWIERAREDPEERIEKQRKHVTEVRYIVESCHFTHLNE